ncbi:MAG: dihydroorotase [Ferrovibrio sp.]
MRYDLVIRNGMVATPNGIEALDIGVKDGRVAALGSLGQADTAATFDANGLTVLPGVIDTQVHFREPGLEHKEDLATGTAAAAMGGVTAVFEMPNTKPSTATAAELADKVQRGMGRTHCDYAFYVGATAENVETLPELEKLPGCVGVKLFMGASTGDLLVADDATLERVLRHGKRRMAVHCEDEYRMRDRKHLTEVPGATAHLHPEWRDAESALLATQRLVRLARKVGRRVHVLHVTTAQEMAWLAGHKDIATVETTPQHLTLAAPDCYDRLGTYAQMNPPIRSVEHRAALWEAVRNGVVDVIGSDHAPHTKEEKAKPYPQSPSGMPGVQTLLPLLLDHMNQGKLTLQRLIDLTSAGAQRLFNLSGKGRIALGYDADFTVVDLKAKRVIEESWLKSKCGWSPFTGMSVTGWPMATIVRGEFAMRDGELGQPVGRPVRFLDTLQPEG